MVRQYLTDLAFYILFILLDRPVRTHTYLWLLLKKMLNNSKVILIHKLFSSCIKYYSINRTGGGGADLDTSFKAMTSV